MPGSDFTIDDARRILDDVFAPWIKDLALTIESIDAVRAPARRRENRAPSCACHSRNGSAARAAWSAVRR